MAKPKGNAQADLVAFDAANSAEGLLHRYAQGRVRGFLSRQVLTLSGAVTLFLVSSPWVALIAAVAALAGELVDVWVLARLPRFGSLKRRELAASLAAMFQATTIAICVALAWHEVEGGAGRFFAMAYLAGAAVNAGIVYSYHPQSARVRLAIYLFLAIGLSLHDALNFGLGDPYLIPDLLGAAMFAYMVVFFLGYVRNSFARRTAFERDVLTQADALAKAETESRQLALVARHASDSVIITGPSREILWVNDTFTRMTGYAFEEAVGRTPGELLNSGETDPATIEQLMAAVAAHQPFRGEIFNRMRDGRNRWVETSLTPIFDEAGAFTMYIGVERDITAAKERALELANARRAAEQGARAKADFLATMSHEIRTPLNGILGMAEILYEGRLDADQRSALETLRDSGRALLSIINDILDISRLEDGRIEVEAVPFAAESCIRQCVGLLGKQASDKAISLEFSAAAALPARVSGDPARLRQIAINLIGNAIKFTDQGGVKVTLSHSPRRGLCLKVRDTGIGIPKDRLDHVFDRFTQAESTINRRFGGTGLGLAISRLLARAMGGDIAVASAPGKGSTFTLRIPCAAVKLQREAAEIAQDMGPPEPGKVRILVAEDNATNRLLIQRMFARTQAQIDFAEDGVAAVAAYRAQRPDLIFMDMSMPGMDGLEATRAIRKSEATDGLDRVPIAGLTANAFAEDRTRCLEAGMDDFLTKPISKAKLFACVAAFTAADATARRAAAAGAAPSTRIANRR